MKLIYLALVISMALLCSCRTLSDKNPNVDASQQVTVGWDIRDINYTASKMIYSLQNHRLARSNPRKIILVMNVKNKTSEHIDTKAITETVMTELLKSGKYKAIAERERTGQLITDGEYSNAMDGSDSTTDEVWDPDDGPSSEVTRIAKPDLIMYGEITGIEKRYSNITDVSYKITLKLVDSVTQMVEWQDQKDIRKQEDGGWFGS